MHGESYKKRANDVRRSARANLLEIRQARLARKTEIVAGEERLQRQPSEASDVHAASVGSASQNTETAPRLGTSSEPSGQLVGADVEIHDPLDELAVKNAALAEISDPVSFDQSSVPDSTVPMDESHDPEIQTEDGAEEDHTDSENSDSQSSTDLGEPIAKEAKSDLHLTDENAAVSNAGGTEISAGPGPDWAQCELAQLPGAGPGLVWMLDQCGVSSMAQLADRDATELAAQLGVVGQILDVGEWVRFAQENVVD